MVLVLVSDVCRVNVANEGRRVLKARKVNRYVNEGIVFDISISTQLCACCYCHLPQIMVYLYSDNCPLGMFSPENFLKVINEMECKVTLLINVYHDKTCA